MRSGRAEQCVTRLLKALSQIVSMVYCWLYPLSWLRFHLTVIVQY